MKAAEPAGLRLIHDKANIMPVTKGIFPVLESDQGMDAGRTV
jgi:hypothetical protein